MIDVVQKMSLHQQMSIVQKTHLSNICKILGNVNIKLRKNDAMKCIDCGLQLVSATEGLGTESMEYAAFLNNRAYAHKIDDNIGYAMMDFSLAAQIRRRHHEKSPTNPVFALALANTLANLAYAHDDQQNYDQATNYALEVVNIREKFLGAENPLLGESWSCLADIYDNLGLASKHTEALRKALAVYEKYPELYARPLSALYYNEGMVHQSQKNYIKAQEYHKKALAIRENLPCRGTNPNYVNSLQALGRTYYRIGISEQAGGSLDQSKGSLAKAEELFKKAWNLLEGAEYETARLKASITNSLVELSRVQQVEKFVKVEPINE